ncbi:MAG: hypothetical protein K2G52_11235 [Muribaculaceae bacterium]|nr:hypothetical protein [Muribaculaceae bacterium]
MRNRTGGGPLQSGRPASDHGRLASDHVRLASVREARFSHGRLAPAGACLLQIMSVVRTK